MMELKKTTLDDVMVVKEHKVLDVNGNPQVLPLLHYPLLNELDIVEHCFTTRLGGVSGGVCASLNLSFSRGDDPEAVMENYRRVAETFGKTVDDFVCTDQTHTTNVLRVGKAEKGYGVTREKPYTDIDGLITNEPGVILSTFYADCVPLYFVDPVNKAIGLSHSGWRGTVGRMGKKTLGAMRDAFGTKPEDVYAAIGPSICQDCYEISEDVAMHFYEEFQGHGDEILINRIEHVRVSLHVRKAGQVKKQTGISELDELFRANQDHIRRIRIPRHHGSIVLAFLQVHVVIGNVHVLLVELADHIVHRTAQDVQAVLCCVVLL